MIYSLLFQTYYLIFSKEHNFYGVFLYFSQFDLVLKV